MVDLGRPAETGKQPVTLTFSRCVGNALSTCLTLERRGQVQTGIERVRPIADAVSPECSSASGSATGGIKARQMGMDTAEDGVVQSDVSWGRALAIAGIV